MIRTDNFISFHDLTPEANYLWISPTVYDVLGHEPEYFVGRSVWDIIHAEDLADSRNAHKENVINDLAVTQAVVRYKHKEGHYIHFLSVFGLCYDMIVNCSTLLDQSAAAYVQRRAHSSVMTRMVGSRKEEFERVRRHHEAFVASTWNPQAMEPELRVCLILNRFTRNLVVMYASGACERVLQVDPDEITGKPILLYLRADDLAPFVEQVDFIKASTAIAQMRFWFQSPSLVRAIPCEAIIIGATDGIVAVIRRCRPFVRRHLIAAAPFYATSGQCTSWSTHPIQSFGSSPATASTTHSPPNCGSYEMKSDSPQSISRSVLDRIRILDLDDEGRSRPLMELPENDPCLVFESTAVTEVPAFKEVIVQRYTESDDEDNDDDVECLGLRDMDIDDNSESGFRR